MSDLISRSELYDELGNKLTWLMAYGDDVYLDVGSDIKDVIDNMPTAYSVDKVVEELEENSSRYTKKYLTPYGNNGYRDTKAISIHKAIEIVKQGGASDDVCEWNQRKGGVGLKAYNISCCDKSLEMPVSTARGLKYCPYCGKKIKVVE